MQLSLKPKTFSKIFLFHFRNLYQILNTLKKTMIVLATSFRKLQSVKEFVIEISKKHRFRKPFDSQHFKGS